MALTAKPQYEAMIRRLHTAIRNSGRSLREIAQMTAGLDPPERLHHSHLSFAINSKHNRMISLRHALVILKIIGAPELALLLDAEPGALPKLDKLMKAAAALSPDQIDQLTASIKERKKP